MATMKEQLEQARKLIEAKRFEDAKALLVTIDHPTAEKWLDKLIKITSPPQETEPELVKQVEKPKAKGKPKKAVKKRTGCLWLILAVLTCMALPGLFGESNSSPSNSSRRTSLPTGTTYYAQGDNIRVRECARLSDSQCPSISVLGRGESIAVVAQVTGDSFSGSTTWYEVSVNGRKGYVHSSLLARTRPPVQVPVQSSSNRSSSQNQSSAPASSSYSCNCSKTCAAMTCQEAYFQLNSCGCGRRDGDNDGVPCESICPGG